MSVIVEANRFFSTVSIFEFLFGTHWSPQIPIREGQVGSSGAFGAVPLFTGTFLIAFIAIIIAINAIKKVPVNRGTAPKAPEEPT